MTTIQLAKKLPDSNDDKVVKVSKAGAKKYGVPFAGNWYGPLPGEPNFTYSDTDPTKTPASTPTPAPPPPAPEPTPTPTPAPPPAFRTGSRTTPQGVEKYASDGRMNVGFTPNGGIGTSGNDGPPAGFDTDLKNGFKRLGIFIKQPDSATYIDDLILQARSIGGFIRGLDTFGGGASFTTLMGQFNAANLSARGGDIDAAKTLPSLSQALLKAAGEQATSSQELKRIQAQTAATLEATQAAIAGRSAAAATAAILANSANAAAATAPAGTAANDEQAATIASLTDELKGLRQNMNDALATIASNTGRTARKLDDVTASTGDALSVASAA